MPLPAVTRVANYAIEGQPLPTGTRIIYDAVRRIVTVELPREAPPLRAAATLVIRDVADASGAVLEPNPTTATIR